MALHKLKTDPIVFNESFEARKPYEIRFDDRDFKIGDELLLVETQYSGDEMKNGKPLIETGRYVRLPIKFILRGPVYGLKEGWVIMS